MLEAHMTGGDIAISSMLFGIYVNLILVCRSLHRIAKALEINSTLGQMNLPPGANRGGIAMAVGKPPAAP